MVFADHFGVVSADHFGVVSADHFGVVSAGVRQVLDECAMKSTAKSTAIRYSGWLWGEHKHDPATAGNNSRRFPGTWRKRHPLQRMEHTSARTEAEAS
ncbi:hypothetical protein [Streptomyces sp. NPDC056160]|uniref:hypothetical protein n=1 Tax=Streptomyces sp. NPDC056160 TaxID=3345731 RepID=UPI0035D8A880